MTDRNLANDESSFITL